jgi:hypothetical protein
VILSVFQRDRVGNGEAREEGPLGGKLEGRFGVEKFGEAAAERGGVGEEVDAVIGRLNLDYSAVGICRKWRLS